MTVKDPLAEAKTEVDQLCDEIDKKHEKSKSDAGIPASTNYRSVFIAGWRPAIGWVCAMALMWHFILFDMFAWFSVNVFSTELPKLNGTDALLTLVLSLLGLGAMRTVEKIKGKAK